MKNRFRILSWVLFVSLLCGCDIHQAIMGQKVDSQQPTVASNSVSEYGNASRVNEYDSGEIIYSNTSDYVQPKVEETPISSTGARNNAPVEGIGVSSEFISIPERAPAPVKESDDVLLVPVKVQQAAPKITDVPAKQGEVVVGVGDTLYSIAQKNNVPLRDLVNENKLVAPYAIRTGQVLKIPGAKYHTVASGETLYSISRAYSVDLNSLAQTNDLKEPYGLAVGQKLRLPAQVNTTESLITAKVMTPIPVVVQPAKVPEKPKPIPSTPSLPVQKPVPVPPKQTPPPVQKPAPITTMPTAVARSAKLFSWPVRGKIVSNFGAKGNGLYNDGINIGAPIGTNVLAAENGVIAYAGSELKGMGNLIIIQHADGFMTVYAHLQSMNAKRGERVAVGQKIGTVGKTGKVSEPQLHFEIRKGTKAYNPTTQLKKSALGGFFITRN